MVSETNEELPRSNRTSTINVVAEIQKGTMEGTNKMNLDEEGGRYIEDNNFEA